VDPVFGGEVVEREQLVEIVGDLRDGLAELRPVSGLEAGHGVEGVAAVFGVPDLGQRLLCAGMRRFWEHPEHVGDLVEPAALFPVLHSQIFVSLIGSAR
jgi:hypothetical protein